MCGIAGWLGFFPEGRDCVPAIMRALERRGPDGRGLRNWPVATLIHTRLSIIDLSPAGAQPMSNEDGTVWTVFNGEIYNHHALRHDLESRGHVFRGRSDSEVLPHLYEEEGSDFVGRLRGMFALAIYDVPNRTLLLARDRFGIKPLFFAPDRRRLAFASNITALLQLPDVDTSSDLQAVSDFAALFYIPAPQTFYSGIRALRPGEVLHAAYKPDGVHVDVRSYQKWTIAPDPDLTLAQAEERTGTLIADAVRPQLESDVPLGALLSGGIDSSLISVAAQAAMPVPLRTFNVRFGERAYDETWAAVAVARHIGSCHETLDIGDVPGTWDYVTGLLGNAGQPFADTSIFAVHAVCRRMRQHVTVALSGDGGDEGFGGYALYRRIAAIAAWQTVPHGLQSGISSALQYIEPFGLVPERMPQRLHELARVDDTSIVQNLLCWVREDEHRRLCRGLGTLPVRRWFEPAWERHLPRAASRLERLSMHATEAYTRLVLPNDFLFKVDTASMAESLEVRVPMLDERLFEFALTLPHALKVRGRTCKPVLRSVARRWLPRDVAIKPKQGFMIPVDAWVTSGFRQTFRETLLGRDSHLSAFFDTESYRPVIDAFCDARPCPGISRQGLYQRAIMLMALHLAAANSRATADRLVGS